VYGVKPVLYTHKPLDNIVKETITRETGELQVTASGGEIPHFLTKIGAVFPPHV
jgi:hypothetical protein